MAAASAARAPAIGIDLGTTYSCVAVFHNDKVEVITNDEGTRTLPSYVAFTTTERIVGEAAKRQAVLNSENTIFDAKRLIGRRYDDPQIQDDLRLWPFKVRNDGGKPKIEVTYRNEVKVFNPEEISAMILYKMKTTAEDFLGKKVRDAVVTVPAYFNDSQRQATKDAGTIAGLNVLRVLNEPTAGALAYGLDKQFKGERKILVYDLGGGTFDVSALVITQGSHFEVKATAGNTHLGGEDFDNKMVDFFVNEFKRKFNKDPTQNPRSIRRLRTACERAKRALSSCTETSIELDAFCDGLDFDSRISRVRFEGLCLDLFQETLTAVQKALHDANFDKEDVDDIVLLGGSSRIPKIQSLLRDFFNGKSLCMSINPDEAVACGAAIQAAVLNKDESNIIKDLALIDVTPMSLGVEIIDGSVERIIQRNTTIPVKKSKVFTTTKDNQRVVTIKIFEGERAMARDNHLLGNFDLEGISPKPRGVPDILVTFDLDADSILHVTACDRGGSNRQKTLRINNDKGRLSAEEIARMIEDAERYNQVDEAHRRRLAAMRKLEHFIFQVKQASDRGLSQGERNRVIRECDAVLNWLDNNRLAEKEEFESRLERLKEICSIVL